MCFKPKESLELSGFYEIPGFSKYLISKEGIVFNRVRGKYIYGGINPVGYLVFRIWSDEKQDVYSVGRYRLLALAFLYPGDTQLNLMVNHIDGDKSNDCIENLEWVSALENLEHAGKHNLTTKCRPIIIKNDTTNECYEFPSLIACARFLDVSKDTVAWRVRSNGTKTWCDGFRYSYMDAGERLISASVLKTRRNNKIILRYCVSGEEQIFNGLSACSEYLHIPISTLANWLNRKDQPVFPGYLQLQYLDDFKPWRTVIDHFLDYESANNKKVIKVLDLITNEVSFFGGLAECADHLGINRVTLFYFLKRKTNTTHSYRKVFRYYTESF